MHVLVHVHTHSPIYTRMCVHACIVQSSGDVKGNLSSCSRIVFEKKKPQAARLGV